MPVLDWLVRMYVYGNRGIYLINLHTHEKQLRKTPQSENRNFIVSVVAALYLYSNKVITTTLVLQQKQLCHCLIIG